MLSGSWKIPHLQSVSLNGTFSLFELIPWLPLSVRTSLAPQGFKTCFVCQPVCDQGEVKRKGDGQCYVTVYCYGVGWGCYGREEAEEKRSQWRFGHLFTQTRLDQVFLLVSHPNLSIYSKKRSTNSAYKVSVHFPDYFCPFCFLFFPFFFICVWFRGKCLGCVMFLCFLGDFSLSEHFAPSIWLVAQGFGLKGALPSLVFVPP